MKSVRKLNKRDLAMTDSKIPTITASMLPLTKNETIAITSPAGVNELSPVPRVIEY